MRNFHQKLMTIRVSHARCLVCILVLLAGLATTAVAQRTPALDVLVLGGRVLDPETGLDAVRNIGIKGGRITVISVGALPAARDTINARGLVVSPGFIELHSHGQDALNNAFLARDGVTLLQARRPRPFSRSIHHFCRNTSRPRSLMQRPLRMSESFRSRRDSCDSSSTRICPGPHVID